MNSFLAKILEFPRRTSLKLKIATLMSVLVLTLTIGFAAFLLYHLEHQLKQNIHHQQFALVESMAGNIDDKLNMAQQSLLRMSQHFSATSLAPAVAQSILDHHDDQLVIFDQGVHLFAPGGDLIAESPYLPDRRGSNFAYRDYFRRTLVSGRPLISEPYSSSKAGHPPVIMFTAPVYDGSGNLIAVLGGAIKLLGENFLAQISRTRVGETGYVYLYNDQRTLILHPDHKRILKQDVPPGANRLFDQAIEGFEGTGITVNSRGLKVLASFKRLKTTNWIMAANYPIAEAYTSIWQAKKLVIGSLLPLGVLILAGTLFTLQRLLRPLGQLTDQVRSLTQVSPDHPQPQLWQNEISLLSDAFQAFVAQQAADRASLLEEKNRAEAERVKTEAIIAAIGDGLNIIDTDFKLLYLNHTSRKRLGDVLGTFCYQAIFHLDAPCPDCPMVETFRDGEVHILQKATHLDGELRHYELTVAPIRDPEGRIAAGIELVRDITERWRADEQLRILFAAVEQCPALIMITDPAGRIEYINPKYAEVSGFAHEELYGRQAEELGEQDETERMAMWRAIAAGEEWKGEFHNRKKSGEGFWVAAAIAPVKNQNGVVTHFVKVAEDISERRAMELQLRHVQKMEAIGQLAAGVAHDFNNLLTAIIGYASIQQYKAPEGSALKADLAGILQASNRGTKLTRDLLAFSRKSSPEQMVAACTLIDLNDLVHRGSDLLQRMLGESIELVVRLSPGALSLRANAQLLEQALLNLGANARDAMPKGGRLCLQTESVCLDQRFVARHGYGAPGRYALLTLADTGSGIDRETVKRIFDPFFTTKEAGKGTGLGLSITYGIVKQHHGSITCYSQPELGTTFRLFLPLPGGAESAVVDQFPGGRGTIVLADEDETARALWGARLEAAGYRIIEAGDAAQAMPLLRGHSQTIQALVLDAHLAKTIGGELQGALQALDSETKIIFCSEAPVETARRNGLVPAGADVLEKPFSTHQLLAKIREVLNR
ncbi:MAG: PAS domain-containing protein [Trichloromonadaceae bacterium]